MNALKSLTAGLTGSAALTGLHQVLRDVKNAPRVDLLGEQAVVKYFGKNVKMNRDQAYYGALAGDLVSNTLYYSIIAKSKRPVLTGLVMGVAAGYLATLMPGLLGLKKKYVNSNPKKKYMTIGYYAFGGLVAGLASKMVGK